MRKRNIATKCLLGMLLVAAALLVMAGCSGKKNTSQTTDPAADAQPEYTLYWNVDRDKHRSSDGSPVEDRKPAEDGNYYVRLFRDGQIQEFMLAAPYLVDAVDASYLVPVVVDESGTITQVLELFDLDITLRAANHYVYQIDGNVVQTNSSYRYDGTDDPLTIEEYTKVYDMTGTSGQVLKADAKEGLVIAAGEGALRVIELQAQGGKRMRAQDYLRGHAINQTTIE